jgi:hypothetical protein
MTNSKLYSEKLVILNRLIKESTLTLEEALLLLKEDLPYTTTIPSNPLNTPGITLVTPNPFHNPFQNGHPYQTSLSVALHGSANSASVPNPEAVLSGGADTTSVTTKEPELFTLT